MDPAEEGRETEAEHCHYWWWSQQMDGMAVTLLRLALDPHSLREGLHVSMYSFSHTHTHSFLYPTNIGRMSSMCQSLCLALGGTTVTAVLAAS